ncbi:hypothetical protein RJ639_036447 [Escallonia herrerae]|uniref:Amine oxidase domain-containing protein n=1 Tax=Escallonia herrerae TaxID=1293975 RepID=A0AA89BAF0_9ASTE|nr:hypothetical protein RJ639_036447 [Escallonia herrerae]
MGLKSLAELKPAGMRVYMLISCELILSRDVITLNGQKYPLANHLKQTLGSAFPAATLTRDEKCLWDGKKRLAICGDFCVSPDVEGAILSGMAAASKFAEMFSCL